MKYPILLFVVISVLSCNNEEHTVEPISQAPQIAPPTPTQSQPANTGRGVADTATTSAAPPAPRESVFPIGTYKTLPEIMQHLFSEGSTKSEVRVVQGEPDMIERIDLYQETWYYGDCKVHFKGQLVRAVVNDNKSIRYASLYGTLIFSPDRTEANLAHFLNERIMR